MKVDAYTKAVLTTIAVCLVWICLNGVTPVAQAQATRPQPTPVILVDVNGTPMRSIPVFVNNESLPVAVTNRPLDVAVQSIQRGARWDPIQVQVVRDPSTAMPTP
jgi:hypothetical protein